MEGDHFEMRPGLAVARKNVVYNPDNQFFRKFLKPYYIITRDGQYLFASHQPGRRPDRAFYMVPEGYHLGKGQQSFPLDIGTEIFRIVERYMEDIPLLVQDGIQGEDGYETSLRVATSLVNPHSAYISWMGKLMIFPAKPGPKIQCWNYIIPERLPQECISDIWTIWPDYDPNLPLTLYDFSKMNEGVRRVLSLSVDYFGGAYKKPNLTMVWNKAESDGLITYHAGCTQDRVLKGLSGTGKTTLTVGEHLEQDDAVLGKPLLDDEGTVGNVQIIGLEAASFAKSESLYPGSPEWPGLMKCREMDGKGNCCLVLAMNIDCEGVDFVHQQIAGHRVRIPRVVNGGEPGSLLCKSYARSGTTNGRFIFPFSDINENWGKGGKKFLRTESLGFKRYDIQEPVFRVKNPEMAVALDSACESIITSAVSGKVPGTRVRSYAATDFMVREQSQQALLKLKVYRELGLGDDGKLVFFITNAGYVGEFDISGHQIFRMNKYGNLIPKRDEFGNVVSKATGRVAYEGYGEKITVQDSKDLVRLVENRKIKTWHEHPIWGYFVPDPKELETVHGLKDFGRRFNPLNYYMAEDYLAFVERDIKERTDFLKELFRGQEGEKELQDVIHVWENRNLVSATDLVEFYDRHYEYRDI